MQSSKLLSFSLFRIMATLTIKRKLAAVSRDTQENARNGQSQSTFVLGMTEEYITQVFEEIGGRVTKKLFQEFSQTELRILGALSKLDEYLLNPQVRTCSVAVPGSSRNNDSENRESTGDRSLNDPYPEVEFSVRQANTSADSDREETYHKTQSWDESYRSRLNPLFLQHLQPLVNFKISYF